MNLYTFRQDVARFMLSMREADDLGQPSPWEGWRPFYNLLADNLSEDGSGDEDVWELLPQERDVLKLGAHERIVKLWPPLFHRTDASMPAIVAGRLSLIPPPLRGYFENFIAETEETTWRNELLWYGSLSPGDRYLWDAFFNYYDILRYSPEYREMEVTESATIPDSIR